MTETQANQAPAGGASTGGKSSAQQAVEKLIERIGKVAEQVSGEAKIRKAGEQEMSKRITELEKSNQALTEQLEKTTQSLFITLALHLDLVAPMRGSDDSEVAEEARAQMNMAVAQQAHIAPELYERQYGVSATTGEPLPGRTVGVPLP